MNEFERYPHVKVFIEHYARQDGADEILRLLDSGVANEGEANTFANFAWRMIDLMYADFDNEIEVL